MNKTAWIVLGATFVVIFGVAAAALALLLVDEVEAPPEARPEGDGRSTMERRLESLENEVRELRKQLKAEREK